MHGDEGDMVHEFSDDNQRVYELYHTDWHSVPCMHLHMCVLSVQAH